MSSENEFGGVDDDGDESTENKPTGGGLRRQLEEALAAKKAYETELAELRSERTARQRNELLEKAGVPAKAHGLYTGEATEEKVAEWVKQYSEVLGLDNDTQGEPDPLAEAARQFQQVENQASGARQPNTVNTLQEKINAAIAANRPEAEINQLLDQLLRSGS